MPTDRLSAGLGPARGTRSPHRPAPSHTRRAAGPSITVRPIYRSVTPAGARHCTGKRLSGVR